MVGEVTVGLRWMWAARVLMAWRAASDRTVTSGAEPQQEGLARRQPYGAIQPYGRAIQHDVLCDRYDELRVLARLSQSRWKGDRCLE